MTTRDRLMLMGIVVLAILLGAWFTTVAPERQRATKLNAEVEAARQQVSSAESQAESAVSARAQYSTAYASLVGLGQAVPSTPETPALIYTLDRATHSRDVQFTSISTGTSGAASSSSSATPAAASTGFTQQPFTFIFNGSFVDLYKLLDQLEGFTAQTSAGDLRVKGRLLTIDSISLAPSATTVQTTKGSGKTEAPELTGTITATAYVLPAGESTPAGASPSGPTAAGSTTPASSTTSAAPAVAAVKASP
jgi:type II secretory pathway pseudopilin PulG